jgi:acetyltransferase
MSLLIIKDCAKKGVKSVMIISAGFGEVGEEGKKIETEIVNVARAAGIRILGPNIIGVINTENNMNSSWMQLSPERGDIAFLSQSGAFCTGVLDMSLKKNLGFYNFCSIGNKSDINELDLVSYWLADDHVKVIGTYLEEVNSGYQLMKLINTHQNKKPVLLFKPGRSDEAKQAIASHTGSMAGSTETIQAAYAQSNLIEVNTATELLSDFMTFSWSKEAKGKRIAIITNAGGPGIMATDKIIENGLELAVLSEDTKTKLKGVLPDAANNHNPVDILGDALAERYLQATEIILQDPNVDCILYIVTPQYITQIEDTAKMIIRTKKFTDKPVFAAFLGEKYISIALERMYDAHVPAFNEIDIAVKAISDLVKYYTTLNNYSEKYSIVANDLNKGNWVKDIQSLISTQTEINALSDDLVNKLTYEVGLDIPKQLVVGNLEQALSFSQSLYPVVIKATNKDIAHKTDFKALYTNLNNENELTTSYNTLMQTIKDKTGNQNPQILVQEQINAQEEIFIGSNREGSADVYESFQNKGFGHLIVMGKGGIYTEVYKDLAYQLLPSNRDELKQAFLRTKVSKIILGTRGQEPLALEKIVDTLEKIQRLLLLYPMITSIDINPLLITKERAVSVDIKIFVA